MKDRLGRVLMRNDPDLAVYATSQDVFRYNSHGSRTIGLMLIIVFLVLSTVSTALRILVRTRVLAAVGRDDHCILAAQLGLCVYAGFQITQFVYGAGTTQSHMTVHNAEVGLKYWLLGAITYAATTALIKIGIGFFLLRFAMHRAQRALLCGMMAAAGVIGVAYAIFLGLTCAPFAFFWELGPSREGYCFPAGIWLQIGYFVAACNAFADAIFAVVPAVIVWTMSMKLRTKVVTYALLGLGSVAVVATIVRIAYLHDFSDYKGDFLYDTALIAMLSTVEIGVGIIAANCATLRPLLMMAKRRVSVVVGRGPNDGRDHVTVAKQRHVHMLMTFRVWGEASQTPLSAQRWQAQKREDRGAQKERRAGQGRGPVQAMEEGRAGKVRATCREDAGNDTEMDEAEE